MTYHQLFSSSRLFFTVNALASIGLNIGVVGVNWFIIDITKSNQLLGIYGALSLVSALITLALAGAVMDRYSKLALLRFCCAGQAGLFFLTALLNYCHLSVQWIIYGLAVFNMPLMVLFTIVSRGAVAFIWNDTALARGNAILEITLQIGAIAAALLTGVLYHSFGFSLLISLAGILCLVPTFLLMKWPILNDSYSSKTSSFIRDLQDGWHYLTQHKTGFLYGLLAFIPTIIISVSNTVIPGYVEQSLGKESFTYGMGDMCFGVGALLAGFIGIRWKQFQRKSLYSFFMLVAICLGVLQIGQDVLLFYGMVFVLGISLAQLRILLNTLFMKQISAEYLGRSLSLAMAISMVFQAILSYVVGSWMDLQGATSGFMWLLGLSLLGLCLLGITNRLDVGSAMSDK